MTTFHFHFPDPPPELRFDAAPVDGDHPGAAALREYWRERRARSMFGDYWHRIESFDDALRVFGISAEAAPETR